MLSRPNKLRSISAPTSVVEEGNPGLETLRPLPMWRQRGSLSLHRLWYSCYSWHFRFVLCSQERAWTLENYLEATGIPLAVNKECLSSHQKRLDDDGWYNEVEETLCQVRVLTQFRCMVTTDQWASNFVATGNFVAKQDEELCEQLIILTTLAAVLVQLLPTNLKYPFCTDIYSADIVAIRTPRGQPSS